MRRYYQWAEDACMWLYDKRKDMHKKSGPTKLLGKVLYRISNLIVWSEKIPCYLGYHHAVPDHCGIPAHDCCGGCGKRMPYQGPDVEGRTAWLKKSIDELNIKSPDDNE